MGGINGIRRTEGDLYKNLATESCTRCPAAMWLTSRKSLKAYPRLTDDRSHGPGKAISFIGQLQPRDGPTHAAFLSRQLVMSELCKPCRSTDFDQACHGITIVVDPPTLLNGAMVTTWAHQGAVRCCPMFIAFLNTCVKST